MRRLLSTAECFEPRGMPLAAGRSLLAFAESTVLLANPDRILFSPFPDTAPDAVCSGVSALSLWCVSGSGALSHSVDRIVAITVLVAVVLGFRPRWLCIPHWYVAFSLAVDMTFINGGEQIAQILAGLLIPICLGDRRRWQWARPAEPMSPAWRGSACAAHLLLRCQVVVIYFDAALSKLAFPSWQRGTAVPKLLNDPQFGLPPEARSLVEEVLDPTWIGAMLTWAVITAELSIGFSMLFHAGIRHWGLIMAICLHSAIILAMGLFSFGLIMISLLAVVSAGDLRWHARLDEGAAG